MSYEISYRSFPPKIVQGVAVIPHIQLVKVQLGRRARLNLLADNRTRSHESTSTDLLFAEEVTRNQQAQVIIASNAGNAPVHEWEVNYDESQGNHALAAKDHESIENPLPGRSYYCLLDNGEGRMDLGYVKFTSLGVSLNPYVHKAIGGRPLVHFGHPVHLSEILQKSITDPRHVLLLPEVPVGETYLPLGLRTIQASLRRGEADHLTAMIENGHYLRIDLDLEKEACQELTPEIIVRALLAYGYPESLFRLYNHPEHGNYLYFKVRLNPYRHTFWAKRGQEWFIGIIGNELPPHSDEAHQDIYNRVLKPVGLTIRELQAFLVDELQVEEAVLMGNGKDPRIYISEYPHDPDQVIRLADDDARDSISAGLVSLVVNE